MKLTLELLSVLGACEDGTKFAVRNNLIGMDLDRIIVASNKYRDCFGFIHWLECRMVNYDRIVYDNNGKIIEMYKGDNLCYERKFDVSGNRVYLYNIDTTIKSKFDGELVEELTTFVGNTTIEYKRLFKNGFCVYAEKTRIADNGERIIVARSTSTTNDSDNIVVNEYQLLRFELLLVNTLTYVDGVLQTKFMHMSNDTINHDKNGFPISHINEDGKVIMSWEYDDRGNNTKESIFENNRVYSTTRVFDENDNVIETKSTDSNNGYSNLRRREYDARGNLIRSESTNRENTRIEKYNYTFDENGVLSQLDVTIDEINSNHTNSKTKHSKVVL